MVTGLVKQYVSNRILAFIGSVGIGLVTALVLALGTPSPGAVHAANPNPGVLPTNSHAFGKTYSEWSAAWWQWMISIPAATNPALDTTGANCAVGQSGPVWFLAGTFGTNPPGITRTCTVPAGRAILFSILTQLNGAGGFDCTPTDPPPHMPCDVKTLRATAAASMDNPQLLEASVDGQLLQALSSYRVQSPVFPVTIPKGAIFNITPAGTWSPNVADGYFLLLAPLPAGTHTIHIKGVGSGGGFESEETYHLTIKCENQQGDQNGNAQCSQGNQR